MADLPERDMDYLVEEAGSKCPLKAGEVVRFANRWTSDFLAGGMILSFDVRRESGEVVTIRRGPEYGARLIGQPEVRV